MSDTHAVEKKCLKGKGSPGEVSYLEFGDGCSKYLVPGMSLKYFRLPQAQFIRYLETQMLLTST